MGKFTAWSMMMLMPLAMLFGGDPSNLPPIPRAGSPEVLELLDFIDRRAEAGDYAGVAVAVNTVVELLPLSLGNETLHAFQRIAAASEVLDERDDAVPPPWPVAEQFDLFGPSYKSPNPGGPPSIPHLAMFFLGGDSEDGIFPLAYVDYTLFGDVPEAMSREGTVDGLFLEIVSPDEETALHDEIVQSGGGLWDAPAASRRLAEIGNRLLQVAPEGALPPLRLHLVDDGAACQALASPYGGIYVTRGLYESASDDDMLAFVLAHELGHLLHEDRNVNRLRTTVASFGRWLLGQVERVWGNGGASPWRDNHRDLDLELQADAVALQLTEAAGYSATQLPQFLATCDVDEAEAAARVAAFEELRARRDGATEMDASRIAPVAFMHDGRGALEAAEMAYRWQFFGDESGEEYIHPETRAILFVGTNLARQLGMDMPAAMAEMFDKSTSDGAVPRIVATLQKYAAPFAKIRVEIVLEGSDADAVIPRMRLLPVSVYVMQDPTGRWRAVGFAWQPDTAERPRRFHNPDPLNWDVRIGYEWPFGKEVPAAEAWQQDVEHVVIGEFLHRLLNEDDFERMQGWASQDVLAAVEQFHRNWHGGRAALQTEFGREWDALMQAWEKGGLPPEIVGSSTPSFEMQMEVALLDATVTRTEDLSFVQGLLRLSLGEAGLGYRFEPMYLPAGFVLRRDGGSALGFLVDSVH